MTNSAYEKGVQGVRRTQGRRVMALNNHQNTIVRLAQNTLVPSYMAIARNDTELDAVLFNNFRDPVYELRISVINFSQKL